MWWYLGVRPLGIDQFTGVEPSWIGLVPLSISPRELVIPSTQWGHSKTTAIYKPKSELSPNIKSAGILSLDFLLSQEIHFCAYKPPSLWYFFYSSLNGLRPLLVKACHKKSTKSCCRWNMEQKMCLFAMVFVEAEFYLDVMLMRAQK